MKFNPKKEIGYYFDEERFNACYNGKNSIINNAEKYSLNNLTVEITRKCNFRCRHCMRGQAQDVTITPRIIDRLFEQVEDVKGFILLTGGEVLLEMDMVVYFCNKLIESSWNPKFLQIGTNGTITSENERLIKLMEKVYNQKGIICGIFISDDIFHAEFDRQSTRLKTYDYFRNNTKDICVSIKPLNVHDGKIELEPYGNAKENQEQLDNVYWLTPKQIKHKISVIDNCVMCQLSFLANGKISQHQDCDYKYEDNHILGNILLEDFKPIINRHNESSIYECWEMRNYTSLKFTEIENAPTLNYVKLHIFRYERVFEIREMAKKLFPQMTAEAIIKRFTIPTESEWNELVEKMIKASKYKVSGAADITEMLQDTKADFGKYNLYSANKYRVKRWLQENM